MDEMNKMIESNCGVIVITQHLPFSWFYLGAGASCKVNHVSGQTWAAFGIKCLLIQYYNMVTA